MAVKRWNVFWAKQRRRVDAHGLCHYSLFCRERESNDWLTGGGEGKTGRYHIWLRYIWMHIGFGDIHKWLKVAHEICSSWLHLHLIMSMETTRNVFQNNMRTFLPGLCLLMLPSCSLGLQIQAPHLSFYLAIYFQPQLRKLFSEYLQLTAIIYI